MTGKALWKPRGEGAILTSMKAGAEILYSEDFPVGRKYGSIEVVNPLQE
jgi:predicted nucleic acid-binding protein